MEADPTVAFVLCGCATTKKPYVIQFQYREQGSWVGWFAVDAFEVDDQTGQARRLWAFPGKGRGVCWRSLSVLWRQKLSSRP